MNISQITVNEYTTPSPASVEGHTPLPEVWDLMQQRGIRHLLVKDGESKVVGVLSERDLTTFSQALDFEQIEAQDVMSKNIVSVMSSALLYEVALNMSKAKIGSTIVENEETGELGIFTSTDALNALVEVLRGDAEREMEIEDDMQNHAHSV